MARPSRSRKLLQNAEAALISAIEIYNKPTFAYREETFAILALNAWELLLKAKVLAENGNHPRSLYVYEKRQLPDGSLSAKSYLKYNRAGNVMTIGISKCIVHLQHKRIVFPPAVQKNLEALTEIRDNAVHYVNAGAQLSKQVLEIGTACLRNFIELSKLWFSADLSKYNLYLMPIGFMPSPGAATAILTSPDEKNVVAYLATIMREDTSGSPDFHVSLDVNISFKRTTNAAATAVLVTNDPNALNVTVSEEDIRKQYPLGYAELTKRLKARYIDFIENKKYHAIRKTLKEDPRFFKIRYLDPDNPRSATKDFYSANILMEFDKAYTRKK